MSLVNKLSQEYYFAVRDPIRILQKLAKILGPGLFLGMLIWGPESLSSQQRVVVALFLWMAVWWVQEAIPHFLTALLPILILPLAGFQKVSDVSRHYASKVIFLFLGGFLLARALESSETHRLLARRVLTHFGQNTRRLMLGLGFFTAFLSMWISNTAAALVMIPLGLACLKHHPSARLKQNLVLLVMYAASVGGLATVIGSPPNAIAVGLLKEVSGVELRFFDWLVMSLPFALIGMIVLSLVLAWKIPVEPLEGLSELLQKRSLNLVQRRVLIVFLFALAAWMIIPFFPGIPLSDASIALVAGLSFFPLPGEGPRKILEIEDLRKIPWDILLLFGGGLALSGALKESGLTSRISDLLLGFSHWPTFACLLLIVTLTILFTELNSNTAVASLLIPIFLAADPGLKMEPTMLALSVAFASSLSFMLPIATPPNAIGFATVHVRLREMMKAGFLLNILFVILISVYCFWFLA